jgi:hypothetical protein
LKAARRASGKRRLDLLAEHVVDVWLWTLGRGQGTPCQPMVIALHCAPGRHCSGLGDRMKTLQTAFWMVRVPLPRM